ncbi:hypothetical protein ACOME3_009203 [Neoechinorhynchus agilis]
MEWIVLLVKLLLMSDTWYSPYKDTGDSDIEDMLFDIIRSLVYRLCYADDTKYHAISKIILSQLSGMPSKNKYAVLTERLLAHNRKPFNLLLSVPMAPSIKSSTNERQMQLKSISAWSMFEGIRNASSTYLSWFAPIHQPIRQLRYDHTRLEQHNHYVLCNMNDTCFETITLPEDVYENGIQHSNHPQVILSQSSMNPSELSASSRTPGSAASPKKSSRKRKQNQQKVASRTSTPPQTPFVQGNLTDPIQWNVQQQQPSSSNTSSVSQQSFNQNPQQKNFMVNQDSLIKRNYEQMTNGDWMMTQQQPPTGVNIRPNNPPIISQTQMMPTLMCPGQPATGPQSQSQQQLPPVYYNQPPFHHRLIPMGFRGSNHFMYGGPYDEQRFNAPIKRIRGFQLPNNELYQQQQQQQRCSALNQAATMQYGPPNVGTDPYLRPQMGVGMSQPPPSHSAMLIRNRQALRLPMQPARIMGIPRNISGEAMFQSAEDTNINSGQSSNHTPSVQ